MKRFVMFSVLFFFIISLYANSDSQPIDVKPKETYGTTLPDHSAKTDTENNALNKTTLKEIADLEVNSTKFNNLKKTYKQKQTKEKKNQEFWISKLDSPLLAKAQKEKEEQSKKVILPEKHSVWHVIAMYIPNRLIDLSEIFSMELGFGPQVSLDLTLTKWLEFGGSYGDNYFVEKGYNRQYGGGYQGGYSYSGGWISQDVWLQDYTFGTVRNYIESGREDSLIPSPSETVYKDGDKDFWKIGVHAGFIANVGFAFHPVALANFFTGFAFIRLTDTEDL